MARILTGVQSTGTPHLGNLLGAVLPAIAMADQPKNESFLFIADLHSLTQIKDGACCESIPSIQQLPGWHVVWIPIKPFFTGKVM